MSERDWWAVFFNPDGRIFATCTPTANYVHHQQLVYQDGTRFHEAHVEATNEAEAIAKARAVLRAHYGFGGEA